MFKFIGKLAVVVAVVGLVIWAVFTFSPALREKTEDVYRKYGGWTEQARQADPVGFIDHAMDRLARDIEAMEASRVRLAEVATNLETRLAETTALRAQADELAQEFRAAYREAEAGAGFPVTISGQAYDRQSLRDQVELILTQRRQYAGLIEELSAAQALVAKRQRQLALQIPETQAALEMLPAKREVARVDELTGGAMQLLDEVNGVLNTNQQVLEGSPVRTVEELVRSRQAEAEGPAGAVTADEVTRFLEGGGP